MQFRKLLKLIINKILFCRSVILKKGDLNMFFLFQYKKNGLSYGLIKLHEFLCEDIISYFEKGKPTRKRVKEIHKAIKQALRFAKKKKVYPSVTTNRAVELMEELYDELEGTQKVIKEAAIEMENMINEIKEERVLSIHSLVIEAQEYFKEKEIDTGMKFLRKAQSELKEKTLLKTRNKILAGFDSEIKKIKYKIVEKEKSLKNQKRTKFLSMSIPYDEFLSYKLARNFINKLLEIKSSLIVEKI